jgi:uncharacterized membrane protein
MNAKEAAGAAITILGLILLLYALGMGAVNHHIGEGGNKISGDAWATIIGWFLVIIGPAIWFGEAPAKIKEAAGRGGE